MGANGSYDKEMGVVPEVNRTHYDTGLRVAGHKVLISKHDPEKISTILMSNSENPIYLSAKINNNGEIAIRSIDIYENHIIKESIDLVFSKDGCVIPYSPKKGSHSHKWKEVSPGKYGRESHDGNNKFAIDESYSEIIKDIEKFNKQKELWKI